MKGHIQLSEEANGKRIVMNLKPDGEATLFVNDKAFGTYRASWVNEPHHYIVDNVLSRCAKGDEQFDIMMESMLVIIIQRHRQEDVRQVQCFRDPIQTH